MTSINFRVIGLTQTGFKPARTKSPDLPKWKLYTCGHPVWSHVHYIKLQVPRNITQSDDKRRMKETRCSCYSMCRTCYICYLLLYLWNTRYITEKFLGYTTHNAYDICYLLHIIMEHPLYYWELLEIYHSQCLWCTLFATYNYGRLTTLLWTAWDIPLTMLMMYAICYI